MKIYLAAYITETCQDFMFSMFWCCCLQRCWRPCSF